MNATRIEEAKGKDEMHMFLEQCRCYFIAAERLGMLESAIACMSSTPGKRKRAIEFNSIQQVLKKLKVIEDSMKIVGISFGCLDSGEAGMFVICQSPIRLLGDVPGEPNTEAPLK
jgi:hypothetical protein